MAEALAGADSAAVAIAAAAREFTTPERVGSTSLQIWRATTRGPAGRLPGPALADDPLRRHRGRRRLLTALADAVGDRLEIEGVSLEVADQAAAQTRAREAAYADAVDRATQLAGLAGAELGDVQEVVEGGGVGAGPVRAAKPMSEPRRSSPVRPRSAAR